MIISALLSLFDWSHATDTLGSTSVRQIHSAPTVNVVKIVWNRSRFSIAERLRLRYQEVEGPHCAGPLAKFGAQLLVQWAASVKTHQNSSQRLIACTFSSNNVMIIPELLKSC